MTLSAVSAVQSGVNAGTFNFLAAGDPDTFAVFFWLVALVAVIALSIGLIETRKRLAVARKQAALIESRLAEVGQSVEKASQTREAVMFEQHRRMNDLQIAKLTAEVELLQRQIPRGTLEQDRIDASKEYHELMVEKTKLEMDSLRLHIAELRKRMDDWRFGSE